MTPLTLGLSKDSPENIKSNETYVRRDIYSCCHFDSEKRQKLCTSCEIHDVVKVLKKEKTHSIISFEATDKTNDKSCKRILQFHNVGESYLHIFTYENTQCNIWIHNKGEFIILDFGKNDSCLKKYCEDGFKLDDYIFKRKPIKN